METVVGYMKWKKKPGVTIYTVIDGNPYIQGREAKVRMWGGSNGSAWQKIDDKCIGKEIQFLFTEGFGGQAQIVDCTIK